MIVFDKHHVKQAEAMILAPTAGHSVFFEPTPTGSRFAGVDDNGMSAFDCFAKLCSNSSDAGKALDKIEGDPFSAEQSVGRIRNLQQDAARDRVLAVLHGVGDLN